MTQQRMIGILLALATLFILFFDLVPPSDLVAKVLIGLGWLWLLHSGIARGREQRRQSEARLAAQMEVWTAAAIKAAKERQAAATGTGDALPSGQSPTEPAADHH
jgi:hypothetical protein